MYFNLFSFLITTLLVAKCSHGHRDQKFFRKDYTYLEATESFYKIHTVFRTWYEAKRICVNEGARLFFAEDQNEVDVVLAFMNETQSYYSVLVGITDLVAEGVFETIDGRLLYDVYYKWRPREPNNDQDIEDCVELIADGTMNDLPCTFTKPFICKKTQVSVQWNQQCNMAYKDYIYNENFGRCYKFYTTPANWTDAHAMCASQFSYLAVIDSQQEAEYLTQLTAESHRNKSGDYVRDTVLLGFHNQFDEGWTTVKGTSLEDSGYDFWAPGQPDGGDGDKCGSMFYNGRLNDIACDKKSFFICEHEIDTLSSSLDNRFSKDSIA